MFGIKRFQQYVLESKVLVRSDHAALTYLRHTKEPIGQQARWLDFVEQFNVTIQHRSGSANRQLMLCLGDPVSYLAPADNAHVGPDH